MCNVLYSKWFFQNVSLILRTSYLQHQIRNPCYVKGSNKPQCLPEHHFGKPHISSSIFGWCTLLFINTVCDIAHNNSRANNRKNYWNLWPPSESQTGRNEKYLQYKYKTANCQDIYLPCWVVAPYHHLRWEVTHWQVRIIRKSPSIFKETLPTNIVIIRKSYHCKDEANCNRGDQKEIDYTPSSHLDFTPSLFNG